MARPLARRVLGGILRPPRRWPPGRVPERIDGGPRVAPRVHVGVDEVLPPQLAAIGVQRQDVANALRGGKNQNRRGKPCGRRWRSIVHVSSPSSRCTSTRETSSETTPTHATMSGCDPKKWMVAVRCVPSFNSVPASPPPNLPSLPRVNSSAGPTGPCSHHLPSGPGAVTKAWISHGTPSTEPHATTSGRRASRSPGSTSRPIGGGRSPSPSTTTGHLTTTRSHVPSDGPLQPRAPRSGPVAKRGRPRRGNWPGSALGEDLESLHAVSLRVGARRGTNTGPVRP
jgi:hypothetical protein